MPAYVNANDEFVPSVKKTFNMIDNYIYLYHTDTLIALPGYPDSVDDTMAINYSQSNTLAGAAPIYSFSYSGPRQLSINLKFHRDMMNEINTSNSSLNIDNLRDDDYVDLAIRQLQAAAVPKYTLGTRMVNPPIVALRLGNDIFCKGVIAGNITLQYEVPILRNGKYAQVGVSFSIFETDPYDAENVMRLGSFRGLNTDLETRIHNNKEKLI